MNFQEDLKIDKFSLDIECAEQAIKFMSYAEQAVEAEYQRDKLKLQLELLYATIDSEVRITAFNEGRKVTEKQVENTVIMNRVYQDKQAQYLQSIRDASMLISARHAFAQRKDMLEQECRLYLSGYYSEQTGAKTKEVGEEEVRKRIAETRGKY